MTVIYTPWSNLRKDGSMAAGQVSFKDPRKVRKVLVPQRENPIVNRLNKTKVEKHPDLKQEREDRLRELRKRDQATQQARVSSTPSFFSFPPFYYSSRSFVVVIVTAESLLTLSHSSLSRCRKRKRRR